MSETPPLVDHTHEHNDATTALLQISRHRGTARLRVCLRKHKQQGPYLRRRSRWPVPEKTKMFVAVNNFIFPVT